MNMLKLTAAAALVAASLSASAMTPSPTTN